MDTFSYILDNVFVLPFLPKLLVLCHPVDFLLFRAWTFSGHFAARRTESFCLEM